MSPLPAEQQAAVAVAEQRAGAAVMVADRANTTANAAEALVKVAGYTCAEAKAAGYVEGLKAAGYTCAEVIAAGDFMGEVKAAGFTWQEAHGAGYPGHLARTWEQLR